MKITRDKQSKFWVLSSDSRVLYKGRRSPWDDPTIIREAFKRERMLAKAADYRRPIEQTTREPV
jgi:hypothetical protein